MAGLVWFVQIVHYPLFAAVPGPAFARYEALHTLRTTRVVAPLMVLELASALVSVATPAARAHPLLAWGALLLLAAIWLSTFRVQVPRHRELAVGFDARAHHRLLASNWIRTFGWSGRAAIALWLLAAS